MFCIKCGKKLSEEMYYCPNCGKKTVYDIEESIHRKINYDGKIHKCPNCGEILDSFISNCTACGYELRDVRTSDTIKEFFYKIETVKSEEEKEVLIRNFPISNTREDVYEFIIFASTNVKGEATKEVFNAWVAKLEQCYQKAELLFGSDSEFGKIRKIYEKSKKEIDAEKKLHGIKNIGNTITKFYVNMKNPILGVVFTLVIIANIGAMIVGNFESDGTSIFLSVLILVVTYILTSRKRKE